MIPSPSLRRPRGACYDRRAMDRLLLTACALVVPAAQDDAGVRGDRLVKVEILADRAVIRPGEAFTLAAKLTVEPGWHVYWENPGDSGMPTRLEVAAPAGFVVATPLHPAPEREVAEGDIVTFVHKGEVLFLADAKAPERPTEGSKAVFELDASWLVCQEACYPGAGKARLEIPFAAGTSSAPANEKAFAAARARLPRAWKELPEARIEWSGAGEDRTLRITVAKASALELFPLASRTTNLVDRSTEATADRCTLTAHLRHREEETKEGPRLEGVLVVTSAQGTAAYRLDSRPN